MFEETCATHVPGGHEDLLIATPVVAVFAFSLMFGLVRWSVVLAGFGFLCTFFHCLPKSFRKSGSVAQVL